MLGHEPGRARRVRNPTHFKGTGYIVDALLPTFHGSDGFREGTRLAVKLGDDAATTGAICGLTTRCGYAVPRWTCGTNGSSRCSRP